MTIQKKCPVCGMRLFDISIGSTGEILIKCPRCKEVVEIKLKTA